MKLSTALLILVLLSHHASALYDKSDAVVQLTTQNFKAEVLDTEHLVSVEFFAPWCGHCQRLAPEYKKAAENLKGLVKVAAIDCDEESNKPVCAQYGIQGFPTIKLFKNKKVPSDYQGPRTAKPIVDYLLSSMPSYVKSIKQITQGKRDLTLDDFYLTDNATLPKSLLFTNKPSTPPLYKALSIDFKDSMLLGEVGKKETEILEAWGIDNFPTLVVIPAGGGEVVKYDGALKKDNLEVFLGRFVDKKSAPKKENEEAIKEDFHPEPAQIKTQADLDRECLTATSTRLCAIAILPTLSSDEVDPARVRAHADALVVMRTLKEKYRNSIPRFMWVDEIAGEEMIRKFDVARDFPQMVVVEPRRKKWRTFMGAWDVDGIDGFLTGLKGGKTGLWTFEGEVKVVEEKKVKDEL